ncbi:MAG: hypothetical protein DRI94_07790 [Bacteroidetes bacterium]|nr:MAG: hypothetical protein DRI94_07790 [Bacteroidota bacterium]
MSDKPVNSNENNSELVNDNKELSSAEKIHQKINELKTNSKDEKTDETIPLEEGEVSEIIDDSETNKEPAEEKLSDNESDEIQEEIIETKEDIIPVVDNNIVIPKEVPEEQETVLEDYSVYSKEELNEKLNGFLKTDYKASFEKAIRKIKESYNKHTEQDTQEKKASFINDGGKEEDFEPVKDETDIKFKELYQRFLDKKETFEIRLNEEKKKNLELKYQIIEEIKELVNKPETFTKTFNKFRNLQKKWNDIGLVPKNDVKALFDEYNKNIKKFYEYVEVNKELRDLDFKKNYEIKISLCEKAEELFLETNSNRAKKELQTLHKKWKETGAVSNEVRDELWLRFQTTTIKINERYSVYLEEIKEQQEKNLESKQFLVEKAEELSEKDYDTHIDWKQASDKVIEIQKLWKKIGYVPKEFNNKIYSQFKNACDRFFERIRKYYEETEKDREDNYQKKLDLCTSAESLQDSTEWVKTADIYKHIQEEWKKIGPVPKKKSDEIWKRFRKACNNFFDRKKEYYKNRKANEKENLIKKQEIIEKIRNFELSKDQNESLQNLKEFQNEFISIGYVPFEHKDEIYENFHNAVNAQYEKLNISKEKLDEIKFIENIEALKKSPDSDFLIQKEMGKVQNQIDKLNDDIKVWENNIGFFSSSSKSESLLKNITEKIDRTKAKVDSLKKKMIELEKTQE